MISIRAESPADVDAIFEVNEQAFGRKQEAQLVNELRTSDDFIPELSLVAVVDDRIVGHILFSPIVIGTKSSRTSVLSLAPMAVSPGYQDQGIGTELVRQGIHRCRELGHKVIVVVGHPAYYPRFGFVQAREKGIQTTFEVPDEAFMVLELFEGALNGIEGTVRYPAVFERVREFPRRQGPGSRWLRGEPFGFRRRS